MFPELPSGAVVTDKEKATAVFQAMSDPCPCGGSFQLTVPYHIPNSEFVIDFDLDQGRKLLVKTADGRHDVWPTKATCGKCKRAHWRMTPAND